MGTLFILLTVLIFLWVCYQLTPYIGKLIVLFIKLYIIAIAILLIVACIGG